MKTCTKCGKLKDETEFHICNRNTVSGRSAACKDCRNTYLRKYRKHPLVARQRGQDHCRARLTDEDVRLIKMLLVCGDITMREIGEKFEVSHTTVSAISRGVRWAHVEIISKNT